MRKAVFPVCMNILVPLALLSSAAAQTSLPTPTFYPPAGTYQARQQVALWDTAGPTGIASPFQIYYTTDGSTPSFTHGNQYNGAITVNGNETIKAIEFFGGYGIAASGECNQLNDLWMFNVITEEWTWMSGSSTPNPNIAGVSGTLGQFAAANMPGSRAGSVTWTDLSGNLWLFGGGGYDSTGASGDLNDLWEYSTSSHQWAWMGGSKLANQRGAFGTFGQFHSGNIPGARAGAVSWIDGSGNFWLFGGSGYDGVGTNGYLSDLWEFNPSSMQWAWMSGSHYANGYGTCGTMGTPSVYNHPGARSNPVSWEDKDGNLWLFGGTGYAQWSNSLGGTRLS